MSAPSRGHRRGLVGLSGTIAAAAGATYAATGAMQAGFVQPPLRMRQQQQQPRLQQQSPSVDLRAEALGGASAAPPLGLAPAPPQASKGSSSGGLDACWSLAGSLIALRLANAARSAGSSRRSRAVALRSTAEPQVDIVAEARAAKEAAQLELEAARLRKEVEEMERASQEERRTSRARRLCDGASRVSTLELRTRLMEAEKLDLSEDQAKQLVDGVLGAAAVAEAAGDASGLTVEQLSSVSFDEELSRVLQVAREERLRKQAEERELALEKAKEEAAQQVEQQLEAMRASENTDDGIQTRVAAILSYALPLVDNAQFALALAQLFPPAAPLVLFIALPAQAINAIPFGTLIMFFIWATLVNNRDLPRLVRYNLQQSVLLDIATFLPGIFLSFGSFVSGGNGGLNPEASAGIFAFLLLIVGYCVVMSAFGKEAELPGISGASRRAIDQQGTW